tara:strand:+ start:828 stop:1088 length:261 start_codon:yes stop_codon:yes gene_type:complete
MSDLCEYGSRKMEYDSDQETIDVILSDLSYYSTDLEESYQYWGKNEERRKEEFSAMSHYMFEAGEMIKHMREQIFNLEDKLKEVEE